MVENLSYLHKSHSLWLSDIERPKFPKLVDKHNADVVVIGGGIVGVTTALLLQEQGYNTILLEARSLASGASGHTSAKITSQHQVKYSEILKEVGLKKTQLYVKASNAGASLIRQLINKYKIECDYQELPAYVYTTNSQHLASLKQEQQAANKAGLNYEFVKNIESLPFKIAGALQLTGQAQFNPVKYIYGLANAFIKLGGHIYENSRVSKISIANPAWAFTRDGLVETNKLVIATHFPIYDFYNGFTARLHGERSYVIAIKPNSPQPKGIFITADRPILSLRTMIYNGEELLLVGGCGHSTGLYQKSVSPYRILMERIKKFYPHAELIATWSAQDYISLDKLPYIGRLVPWYGEALVATGFAKWGMTMGSVSALILANLVKNNEHPFKKVFSPSRADMLYKFMNLMQNGSRFFKHLVISRIKHQTTELSNIAKGDGGIINYNGKAVGVYRDFNGKLHAVKPYCSHLGCMLSFNKAEKSWDCPCHASRFNYDGSVIESPTRINLETIVLKGFYNGTDKKD
ncbi:FAD-dependent oxidoreductase [Clostridium sp. 'deep sea']|uniref:FAD-dependent oxidoreductase n=1 Tax=Clostridium sp. 'deep sea' TaxID=2779445 RepID=UPI0018969127|nr:FAD-dependent oxidoreductase [Clostridium sp. 'deep sea']QOR36527.1 FAD-dependent oxidoreductase [Clostridium sp. 'deep sea']